MSTIRWFVNNWLWKSKSYITKNWYQCVDLAKLYISNVLWKSYWSIWHAYQYYDNLPSSDFEKIDYNWDKNKPKRWDLIVCNTSKWGWYLHIWVVMAYYKNSIFVLEQNWQSWNWDWRNWNEIRVKKFTSHSWITWWCRYKGISSIIKKDLFDNIVFEKGLYIWEKDLKRKDILDAVFYFLAWYKDNFNWKTWKNLWIISRLEDNTTRQELAYIILAFLNKILNKNLNINSLKNVWIWNWQRPNDKVTGYEFTLMINKTKEVYWL